MVPDYRTPLQDKTNVQMQQATEETTDDASDATKSHSPPTSSAADQELFNLLGPNSPRQNAWKLMPPSCTLTVPVRFRMMIEKSLDEGLITRAVARYYLETLPRGDFTSAPGTNSRPLLLSNVIFEDKAAFDGENAHGYGWRPIKVIGTGAYGSVVLWEKPVGKGSPLRVAAKDSLGLEFFQDYCSEAHLTRRLNDAGCQNVIKVAEWAYVSHSPLDENLYDPKPRHRICYEFAEFSDLRRLHQFYKTRGLILPELFIWHVLYSMANALCYCRHGTNVHPSKQGWDPIVHGDVKLENMFLTTPDADLNPMYPCVKLADFGLAFTMGGSVAAVQHFRSRAQFGTDGYMAPEVEDRTPEIEGRNRKPHELHGPHSDVFSLGMSCKNLLSIVDLHRPAVMNHKRSKSGPNQPVLTPSLVHYYNAELRDLLDHCIAHDARDRPKASRLLSEARFRIESDKGALESRVLYRREDQQRYDDDSTFRQEYMEANLRELWDLIARESLLQKEKPKLVSRQTVTGDRRPAKGANQLDWLLPSLWRK